MGLTESDFFDALTRPSKSAIAQLLIAGDIQQNLDAGALRHWASATRARLSALRPGSYGKGSAPEGWEKMPGWWSTAELETALKELLQLTG